jgi:hypothetical protein
MAKHIVNKSQTGMQGVYLVAADLTYLGYIVSVTSRNAFGADLLVTDRSCKKACSVQVKTNKNKTSCWLLSEHAKSLVSDSHVYVFVNLKGNQRPEYYVVPSEFVASHVYEESRETSTFYSFDRRDLQMTSEGWDVFQTEDEHSTRVAE